MEEILEKLCQTTGVVGAFLAGLDGLAIAGRAPQGMDKDLLSATAADLYRGLADTLDKLDGGQTQFLAIERSADRFFMQRIEGAEALLIVLTEPKINLGLVRMEIQQASAKIKSKL